MVTRGLQHIHINYRASMCYLVQIRQLRSRDAGFLVPGALCWDGEVFLRGFVRRSAGWSRIECKLSVNETKEAVSPTKPNAWASGPNTRWEAAHNHRLCCFSSPSHLRETREHGRCGGLFGPQRKSNNDAPRCVSRSTHRGNIEKGYLWIGRDVRQRLRIGILSPAKHNDLALREVGAVVAHGLRLTPGGD